MENVTHLLLLAQDAYGKQEFEKVEEYCFKAITLEPQNYLPYNIIGLIADVENNLPKAIEYLSKASLYCGDDISVWVNLGNAKKRSGDLGGAADAFEVALTIKPDLEEALTPYCFIKKVQGNIVASMEAAEKAFTCNPSLAAPYANIASCLKDAGNCEDALTYYLEALQRDSKNAVIGSAFLFALNYSDHSNKVIYQEHKAWVERVFEGREGSLLFKRERGERKKIRVGYLSADFRSHSVAYFIKAVLEHHSRYLFDIYCYADVETPDTTTKKLKSLPLLWRDISSLDNREVVNTILSDDIDILVDLGGHAGNRRITLFADKIAPLQVTYLGYPNTTGLSTIDYRITDRWADPLGMESYYSEKLCYLPSGFLLYEAPSPSPDVKTLPALKNGYITFGSFNHLAKIGTRTIEAWSSILKKVPQSKLFLKNRSFKDEAVLNRYKRLFGEAGITEDRLILKAFSPSTYDHLECYNQIDIALDTFPYNGTTTTCEALWMGVPVITLCDKRHAGKVGTSLLSRLGLFSLIAQSEEEYSQIACTTASDVKTLAELRETLRFLVKEKLCNSTTFIAELEEAYRNMWQEYKK